MPGGQTNPNTNTTVTNQTALPQWYQDVLSGTGASGTPGTPGYTAGQPGLIPQAESLAQSQYIPYSGQQVAGLTPDQQAAASVVESTGGNQTGLNWDAYYQNLNAGQSAQQAGNIASGLGYQASPTFQSGLNAAGQGLGYAGQAAQQAYGGANSAQPYLNAATQPTGLAAASPYLGAASGNWTQNASNYMSPYVTGANNALAQQYATNLSQFILPQVQSQFVGLGQTNSPQQANFEANLINQQANSLGQQQAANLNQAYQSGASTYESDAARQAQLAGTAGGLGTSQQQAELQAGLGLGGLTQQGVGSVLGAGQVAGQLGLGTGQLGLGAGQLGTQGLLGAGSLENQTGTALAGLGNLEQQQNLNYASALNSVGTQQQQLGQTSLNTAYQNFLNQQQFPYQNLGYLSNIVHGLPVDQSSVYQSTAPATTGQLQPSVIGQLGGAALGLSGLSGSGNSLGGTSQGVNLSYKQGGIVRDSRRKASYGRSRGERAGLGFAMAA